MRDATTKATLAPANATLGTLTNAMFLPLHGRHITQQNVNGILRGYPTVLTLGANTSITGQWLKIASATPTTYNGYHRILWASGSLVCIDFDSSALAIWSSGGVATFNVAADATGNKGPYDISGTTTNLFADPVNGITADAAGNWVAPFATADTLFNLSGYTGKLLIAFDLYMGAATISSEFMFGINKIDNTGTNSKYGTLTIGIYGGGQNPSLIYRPETSADGGGTNTTVATTSIGAPAYRHCAWIVDCSQGAAPVISAYANGVSMASATANMTNAIGHPDHTKGGVGILCGVDSTGLASGKLGSGGSGAKIHNFLFQKTDESTGDLIARIKKLATLKEYR